MPVDTGDADCGATAEAEAAPAPEAGMVFPSLGTDSAADTPKQAFQQQAI
jgi:hypothetical protein